MAFKSMVTACTAQNATETTKTLAGTITVPYGCTKLIGVGSSILLTGLTTLEGASAILELESDDMTQWAGTQQFPCAHYEVVTSGAGALNPYVFPVDIPVTPGGSIRCSFTFDEALTVTPSCRAHLIFN